MTHQNLIRELTRNREANQVDPWDDPRWDECWTLAEEPRMDKSLICGFLGLATLDAFEGQLRAAFASKELVGEVRAMRVYQTQRIGEDGHGDYQVYFVASFSLQQPGQPMVRVEVRIACGEQDLDQQTEQALPSRKAQAYINRLAALCGELRLPITSAELGDHRR